MNHFVQFGCLILTFVALYFLGQEELFLAGLFGLSSTPFWARAAANNGMWGLQILNLWYLYTWGKLVLSNAI